MISWFKLHHDLPDDIKLRKFTPQEKWAWVTLLCLASKAKVRGVIDADGEDIAEYCEFNTTQDWLYYRDKLIAKGMLEITPDGSLHVLHWESRQYDRPSEHPTAVRDRVRRHRAKKKAGSETQCNALQTPVKRKRNAADTDPDTDPDTEKDSESLSLSDPDYAQETNSVTPAVTQEANSVTNSEPKSGPRESEVAALSGGTPAAQSPEAPQQPNPPEQPSQPRPVAVPQSMQQGSGGGAAGGGLPAALFPYRQPIAVPVTPQFCGPWGSGRTAELERFDSWLQQQARDLGKRDPSGWAFKIIDSIAKGGPLGKWDEFAKSAPGAAPTPADPQDSAWEAEYRQLAAQYPPKDARREFVFAGSNSPDRAKEAWFNQNRRRLTNAAS